MCRQPDVTVNPAQGHQLRAANVECTALLTLTGEGRQEQGQLLFQFSVHGLSPKAKSPKPASQYCCQPWAQGQAELCAMSWGPGPLRAGVVRVPVDVCEQ